MPVGDAAVAGGAPGVGVVEAEVAGAEDTLDAGTEDTPDAGEDAWAQAIAGMRRSMVERRTQAR